ncbi:hypothetical protein [Aeromonas phage Akh-2]|nr:hypothetical protein [Aeromonas phage Akh-2]
MVLLLITQFLMYQEVLYLQLYLSILVLQVLYKITRVLLGSVWKLQSPEIPI